MAYLAELLRLLHVLHGSLPSVVAVLRFAEHWH